MAQIRGVLVDLSGTLHVEDTVIPGCVEALEQLLRTPSLGVRFVIGAAAEIESHRWSSLKLLVVSTSRITNTTKKSRDDLIQELHAIGLTAIKPQNVLTSGSIARSLLTQRGLRPLLLVDPSLEVEFAGLPQENPNAVVVGLAPSHFHYERLNEAFRVLLNGGSLIALHEARYFAVKDGLNLGPGAFVKALEYAANTIATVIGKPSPSYFSQALDSLHVNADEAVMIGDDVHQDVGGAITAGLRGVLVRTGKYRTGDEDTAGISPSFVAADFAEAVAWIAQQNGTS